jgi:hypothetical protein
MVLAHHFAVACLFPMLHHHPSLAASEKLDVTGTDKQHGLHCITLGGGLVNNMASNTRCAQVIWIWTAAAPHQYICVPCACICTSNKQPGRAETYCKGKGRPMFTALPCHACNADQHFVNSNQMTLSSSTAPKKKKGNAKGVVKGARQAFCSAGRRQKCLVIINSTTPNNTVAPNDPEYMEGSKQN